MPGSSASQLSKKASPGMFSLAGLRDDVMKAINTAKRYSEGTGLRFDVMYKKQLPAIRTLIDIKLGNHRFDCYMCQLHTQLTDGNGLLW